MKIYHWEDENGVEHFYTSERAAIRHLRMMQSDGETAVAVSQIELGDAVTLLDEMATENANLRRRVDRLIYEQESGAA